ncbi:MAG: hypothetical protein JRH01_23225 [Deltaproteobacteria bacterium]|nr:hypothetical protein [Deltaproteobacteria bacterium]MBW2394476.1 hypothetical protein [Deltaproteobacteria bacterium]
MIEEAGIPTVLLSTGRDLTAQVLPPRSAFVNFPMGNPFGHPQDVETQRAILFATLRLAETAQKGGTLVDLDHEWDEDFATALD